MLACCRRPEGLAEKALEAEEEATVAVSIGRGVAVVADTMPTQRQRLWCSQERTRVIRWLFSIGTMF